MTEGVPASNIRMSATITIRSSMHQWRSTISARRFSRAGKPATGTTEVVRATCEAAGAKWQQQGC
jgi:hypothetical protein